MTNDHLVAHNPSSVWPSSVRQVPDHFKSVHSHAIEVRARSFEVDSTSNVNRRLRHEVPEHDWFNLKLSCSEEFRRLRLVSGQFGVAPNGDLAGGFGPRREQAMDNVEALLGASGTTTENVARLAYRGTRASDFPTLADIRRRLWALEPGPSVTAIVVSGLARPEYLIEIEAAAADMGEKQ